MIARWTHPPTTIDNRRSGRRILARMGRVVPILGDV
jgi:hypothetical protein